MNDDDNPSPVCCFHPGEAVVGVCAPCLKKKLLALAARRGRRRRRLPQLLKDGLRSSFSRPGCGKKPSVAATPHVLALGSSVLHRLDDGFVFDSGDSSTDSPDDSFISIRFEEGGRASWDKAGHPDRAAWGPAAATPGDGSPRSGTVAARSCPADDGRGHHGGGIRWRKRIGRLLRLPGWKRASQLASLCGVGAAGTAADGVGGRRRARNEDRV